MTSIALSGMFPGTKVENATAWQVGDILFIAEGGNVHAVRTRVKPHTVVIGFDARWNVNDAQRSAFCKLTGQSLADLKRTIKAKRERESKRSAEADIDRMKRLAARHGFKVAKKK